MELQKATIAELDGDTEKDSFPVQFNPTTLRLALSNRVEGGDSQGKQVRQHIGASSTTLTLDLVFDTADEGTTENPRSVREKTKKIERFLVSKGEGKQENAPPRIRFTWGDLIVEGVIESLTIDFEHFAPNGVPLRAKVPLSIRGQDREKELKTASDSRSGAPAPGGGATGGLGGALGGGLSAGVGFGVSAGIGIGIGGSVGIGIGGSAGIGIGASASIGVALDGESAGEFAARVGVDPAAWRGLQMGGESSLSLSAGVEVGFDVNLNASAGLGVAVGVEAGTTASVEEKLGLATGPGVNAVSGVGIGNELASGFALSSAGGLGAALELAQVSKSSAAESETRSAFNAPPKALPPATAATTQSSTSSQTSATSPAKASTVTPPARTEPARVPLTQTGFPSVSAQTAAAPAARPPRADVRASSFGFGVPLRTTIGAATDDRAGSIQGDVAVRPRITSGEPPTTTDPTTPGWVALPVGAAGRTMSDAIQRSRKGCGCGCQH